METATMKTAMEFLGPDPLTGAEGTRGVHWLRREDGDRLWLILDKQGESANTIDEAVLRELDMQLSRIEDEDWRAVILRSAKPSGFCHGADIAMFRDLEGSAELRRLVDEANAVIDRLAALRATTVAVVHGPCLGGGLELALACDRIVARDDATMGLPEVLLGLHPGLGGTARLTHRIQPLEAMKLMLTGRTVKARKAKSLGIADAVVPERNVANAVDAAVSGKLPRKEGGLVGGAMSLKLARKALARQMRGETAKRVPERHYPAPYALIDLWEKHGGSVADMLDAERESFVRLLPLQTTQNLVRVFFLRERLKANGKGRSGVSHVHVVGAGTMGADIGSWCALRGMRVTIEDPDRKSLARAVKSAHKLFDRKLKASADAVAAKDHFVPDTHGLGVRSADLIIEAAPERVDLKRRIYARIEEEARPDAILATNTSSLDMNELAEGLSRPAQFVGIHFFNPVSRLELVEVVRHDGTGDDAFGTARKFVGDISRLPLPVKASPGFLVNRALMPYLGEALLMLDEGEQPERIDAAAEDFGMPMGPIELADQVGLDICVAVADSLARDLDKPLPPMPQWLRDKVAAGDLGKKTGRGIYEYGSDGKPKKDRVASAPDAAMTDRLVLPMVNTVAAALDEGVVEDADSADAAMIFATGFAPFRGGPMHYARLRGFEETASVLELLEEALGDRFTPAAWWRKAT